MIDINEVRKAARESYLAPKERIAKQIEDTIRANSTIGLFDATVFYYKNEAEYLKQLQIEYQNNGYKFEYSNDTINISWEE